jgi:hypothetical protein
MSRIQRIPHKFTPMPGLRQWIQLTARTGKQACLRASAVSAAITPMFDFGYEPLTVRDSK